MTLDIANLVRPGDGLIWGQAAVEPTHLLRLLNDQLDRFPPDCRALAGLSLTETFDARRLAATLKVTAFGGAVTNRRLQSLGALDVLPVNYSAIPDLVRQQVIRTDVALVQLAADGDAYNIGALADYMLDAITAARVVIAEVNDRMPATFGDTAIARGDVDHVIHVSHPLVEMRASTPTDTERAIGQHIARLVPDGATIETGLGVIPDAALAGLSTKRDLGVHSGTIGDGVMALMEAGVVTNRRKPIDTGLTVTGGLLGTEQLYRWAHRNFALQLRTPRHTHHPAVIACLPNFIGINGAIEVDLTGQVNAEMAGGRHIGMLGGHGDFMRGAQFSRGGIGIVALPTTAMGHKASRIVPRLADGVVTTARGDADIVVTEYGIAELKGRSLSERSKALIAIAHPDFRPALEKSAEAGLF